MRGTIVLMVAASLIVAACGNQKQTAKEALENVAIKYYPPVNGMQCAVAVNTDIERMPMACVAVNPGQEVKPGTYSMPTTAVVQ